MLYFKLSAGELLIMSCIKNNAQFLFLNTPKKWFTSKEEKELYNFVSKYYSQHSIFPTDTEISFGLKKLYTTVEGLPDFFRDKLKSEYVLNEITDKLPSILAGADEDPLKTASKLDELLASFVETSANSSDVNYGTNTLDRLKLYKEAKKSDGITHLSTGDSLLDALFYGWKKTDYTAIAGVTGVGKSWMLIKLALLLDKWILGVGSGTINHFTEVDLNRPILFISNEMNIQDVSERFDSLRFNLPYTKLLRTILTDEQETQYEEGLIQLENEKSNIELFQGVKTFEELQLLIDKYNPLKIFIDAAYLMLPHLKEDNAKLKLISSGIKAVSLKNDIPITATYQLKKYSGKGSKDDDGKEEFPYTLVDDVDFALRLFSNSILSLNKCIGINFAKGRRIPPNQKIAFILDLDTPNCSFIPYADFEES